MRSQLEERRKARNFFPSFLESHTFLCWIGEQHTWWYIPTTHTHNASKGRLAIEIWFKNQIWSCCNVKTTLLLLILPESYPKPESTISISSIEQRFRVEDWWWWWLEILIWLNWLIEIEHSHTIYTHLKHEKHTFVVDQMWWWIVDKFGWFDLVVYRRCFLWMWAVWQIYIFLNISRVKSIEKILRNQRE